MRVGRILIYLFLIFFIFIWIMPLVSLVLTSLKSEQQILYLPFWSLPSKVYFVENVLLAMETGNLGRAFINTIFYSLSSACAGVFLASMIAFPIAKMNFKGKNLIFYLALIGTFLPFQMYLLPHVHILRIFKLYDTWIGLWLVYTAIVIPFAILVIRNYMLTIPDSIIDAAKLDGCSYIGIYGRIMLPLTVPALTVAFLFQFIWVWNDMIFGLVLTANSSTRPLMTQLAMLKGGYITSFGAMAAGSIISIFIPIVVILVFQEKFIQGFRAPM